MKRLYLIICLVTFLMTGLAGCGSRVAILDHELSNPGGRLLNPVIESDIGFYFNSTQRQQLSLRYFDKDCINQIL